MLGRLRDGLATVTSAPWRRAPVLLWRRPGVLAAVAAAYLVLTASLAAVPLFLSSVGTAALDHQAASRCHWTAGASIEATDLVGRFTRVLDQVTTGVPGVGERILTQYSPVGFTIGAPGVAGTSALVHMMSRDRALDHVEVVDGEGGPGVWITESTTRLTGLGQGDTAALGYAGNVTEVLIAGVYADLAGRPLDDFWCSQFEVLRPGSFTGDLPAPLMLVDQATFDGLFHALDARFRSILFEVPIVVESLTLREAAAITAEFARWPEQIAYELRESPTAHPNPPTLRTSLDFITTRSQAIVTSVGGGVVPVAAAAGAAGAIMIAAAASLWFDRRRAEVDLLTVRGVSPAAIGVKAVLELAVAAVVGSAAGLATAYALVSALGPSDRIAADAVATARTLTLLAAAGATVVLAGVVALRARARDVGRRRLRLRIGLLPWEVGLAALAWVSYRRLGHWGVPLARGAEVSKVDQLGLAFPLFFLGAGLSVIARLLSVSLRLLRRRSGGWPTTLFLAVRRVDAFKVAAIALVAVSAVATGVLAYAGTLTSSLNATLAAKVKTFVGSDIAVRVSPEESIPSVLGEHATRVLVFDDAEVNGRAIDVLGVDPETFARGAFWDDSFSGTALGDLMHAVSEGGGQAVRAIGVGFDLPDGATVAIDSRTVVELELARAGQADVFPTIGGRPGVVVNASALDSPDLRPSVEYWIEGDPDEILATLRDAGTEIRFQRDASEVIDQSSFLTVAWTFGFLQSLGVAAAITTVGGMAIYLDARRRARVLAYAFARRMGLASVAHRRTLFAELAATVVLVSARLREW